MAKTAEVITKTGIFDGVDNLYGKKTAAPAAGAEAGAEPGAEPAGADMGMDMGVGAPEAAPAEPAGGEVTPENFTKNDLNLLVEEKLFLGKIFIIFFEKVFSQLSHPISF